MVIFCMKLKTKKMPASSNLISQIDKYIKPKSKDITVFDGCVTELEGTNIITINPIKIVVNSKRSKKRRIETS